MKSQQALEETSSQTAAEHVIVEKGTPLEERSLSRLIAESDLYDFKATARALLTAIALMTMSDVDDPYPEDAPEAYKGKNKLGWCWLSQWKLGLRVGISESQINRLISMFIDDGVLEPRYWHDEFGVLHAEYKINKKVLMAHQRPSQTKNVKRPKRYSGERQANKGSFSTTNQPKKKTNPGAEMNEE